MSTSTATAVERLVYSPAEVAQALGVSETTVYTMLADGAFPSIKMGGSRRIRADVLVAFLDRIQAEQAS